MSEPSVYVCDAVLLVEKLHQHLFDDSFLAQTIHEQLARQAQNLFKAHQAGNTAAVVEISNFLPRLEGASTHEILAALLNTNPTLVRKRSQFKHQATLLHYISANGVEIRRQKTPYNAVEITRILIAAGAYVNAKAYLYGGYYTTMAMLISSAHSRDAGVQDALIKVFLEAGASSETTH